MSFTKFTHTLLKHSQTGQRPSMECAKREKRELSDNLFENFYLFRKDFSFVVNFVKSRKSKTQNDFYKMYSHAIKAPPSKSETHHGVYET